VHCSAWIKRIAFAHGKENMTRIHLLAVVGLSVIAVAAYLLIIHKEPAGGSEFQRRCSELKQGMTRQQVESMVGRPQTISFHTFKSLTEETWCYDCRSIRATPAVCCFDSTSGLLIKVQCGD
jgi:hypothetical protein